jgi:hypothetical protein
MLMVIKHVTLFADDICNHPHRRTGVVLENQVRKFNRRLFSADPVHFMTVHNFLAKCITEGFVPSEGKSKPSRLVLGLKPQVVAASGRLD